jgi:peptide deformylase
MNTYEEGCLSFPGHYSDVIRPKLVKIKYVDENGSEQLIEADGLLSTCVQHEIDHLDGIVFVDHISRMKRDIIMRKMVKSHRLGEFDEEDNSGAIAI